MRGAGGACGKRGQMPDTTSNKPPKAVLKALTFDLPNKYDPLNSASKSPLTLTYSFDPAAIAKFDLGYSGWSPSPPR